MKTKKYHISVNSIEEHTRYEFSVKIDPRFVFTPQQLKEQYGRRKVPKNIEVYIYYHKTFFPKTETYDLSINLESNNCDMYLNSADNIKDSNFIKDKNTYWEQNIGFTTTTLEKDTHPKILLYILGKHKIL